MSKGIIEILNFISILEVIKDAVNDCFLKYLFLNII
jgi:hypothetical protein